jgi:hypothetical protein
MTRRTRELIALQSVLFGLGCSPEVIQAPPTDGVLNMAQGYQPPTNCAPCHPRQYAETQLSVMSGYRAVSPLMNSLELAGNFLAQGALEGGGIGSNLRPLYGEEANMVNSTEILSRDQQRSAFCVGCHNPAVVLMGEDEAAREVPEWQGRFGPADEACVADGRTACFRPIEGARPLRDYHLRDAEGRQVLPETPGGLPPPGARPSLGAHGVSCDVCHTTVAPDVLRSPSRDGVANGALELRLSRVKVGPFADALPVGPLPGVGDPDGMPFHFSSTDPQSIDYLRSSLFCNACHDVRLPTRNLIVAEGTPPFFRLENLGTEWATQAYARTGGANPFGAPIRCQDCHMSLYPYGGEAEYTVTDPIDERSYTVRSPRPGVFAEATTAAGEDPTGLGPDTPLPKRKVVSHQITGVDVPLMADDELRARLAADRPDSDTEGVDEFGTPRSMSQRRRDLLDASVRLYLDKTDPSARLGRPFDVRVTAIALTGHNFPAGFSQERTTWIELTVSAKRRGGGEDFVLYRSGYQVDKAHPETGEDAPDGSLDDEDLEHLNVVVNPFTHDNEIYVPGPDAGPLERAFEGEPSGLVLFRNELIRVYGPAEFGGRPTGIPASNRRHPRTGEVLRHVLEEETFSAGAANAVDNWRALLPLVPRTYRYRVELPSAAQLAELGVELEGPIQVRAAVHFQHFPPLFLRFLARVSGAVPYRMPAPEERPVGFDASRPGFAGFEGRRGPADRDYGLVDEQRIDDYLRVVRDIAVAETTVELSR